MSILSMLPKVRSARSQMNLFTLLTASYGCAGSSGAVEDPAWKSPHVRWARHLHGLVQQAPNGWATHDAEGFGNCRSVYSGRLTPDVSGACILTPCARWKSLGNVQTPIEGFHPAPADRRNLQTWVRPVKPFPYLRKPPEANGCATQNLQVSLPAYGAKLPALSPSPVHTLAPHPQGQVAELKQNRNPGYENYRHRRELDRRQQGRAYFPTSRLNR